MRRGGRPFAFILDAVGSDMIVDCSIEVLYGMERCKRGPWVARGRAIGLYIVNRSCESPDISKAGSSLRSPRSMMDFFPRGFDSSFPSPWNDGHSNYPLLVTRISSSDQQEKIHITLEDNDSSYRYDIILCFFVAFPDNLL